MVFPTVEFAYNNSVDRSTDHSPFEVVQGFSPRQPLDLVSLPIEFRPTASVQSFANHIRNLHDTIKRKIALSNNHYKLIANARHRHKEFKIGDLVMIGLAPKRFPKHAAKKLSARSLGPSLLLKDLELTPIYVIYQRI